MGLADRRAHAFKCCSCVRLCSGGKIFSFQYTAHWQTGKNSACGEVSVNQILCIYKVVKRYPV